ncbi:MAG: hypothetical protein ABL907_22510 [Hyphomicrobium sp.]
MNIKLAGCAATLGLMAGGLSILFAGPAEARIACRNGYQMVAGSPIATPYCQDELLAAVARDHGMKAQAARIRDNPNYKREVCRFVGNDIRISEHCLDERPGNNRGGGGR